MLLVYASFVNMILVYASSVNMIYVNQSITFIRCCMLVYS
jgi:hypothetical protein